VTGKQEDSAIQTGEGSKRPRLRGKRVVTKEDGRYLIFYEFSDGECAEEQES